MTIRLIEIRYGLKQQKNVINQFFACIRYRTSQSSLHVVPQNFAQRKKCTDNTMEIHSMSEGFFNQCMPWTCLGQAWVISQRAPVCCKGVPTGKWAQGQRDAWKPACKKPNTCHHHCPYSIHMTACFTLQTMENVHKLDRLWSFNVRELLAVINSNQM